MILDPYLLSFILLFVAGLYLFGKLPSTDRLALVLFKFNSHIGIKSMKQIGLRFKRFWNFIGNFALCVLFGAIGTAYVAHHVEEKYQRLIVAFMSFFFFQALLFFTIHPVNYLRFIISALIALSLYHFSARLSKGQKTLLVFIFSAVFFSYPHLLPEPGILNVLTALSIGIFGLPALIVVSLAINGIDIATGTTNQPGINVGYPASENGELGLKYSGTDVFLPLFPALVALIILLFFHEGFHGLVASACNIKIKNTGLFSLSIIPLGAFVEPDEKDFKKKPKLSQMKVYAVGSFANIFVVALACVIIAGILTSTGAIETEGFVVGNVMNESPAAAVLKPGTIVYGVNDHKTDSFFDFLSFMSNTTAGQEITLHTDAGPVILTLTENPDSETGFAGIVRNFDPIMYTFAWQLSTSNLKETEWLDFFHLLKWVFFINFMVGLFNLLPLKPLDGGYIYEEFIIWLSGIFGAKSHNIGEIIALILFSLIFLIFLMNLAPYLF